jgi:hypothetical protein
MFSAVSLGGEVLLLEAPLLLFSSASSFIFTSYKCV